MMNADTLYSVLLMLALATAAPAALLGMLSLFSVALGPTEKWRLSRSIPLLLTVAVVMGATSLIIHASMGHGAGSAEPMATRAFLINHEAFTLLAGFIVTGSAACLARRRK